MLYKDKPNVLVRNQKVAASGWWWGVLTRWGHKGNFWDDRKILKDDMIAYSCQNTENRIPKICMFCCM